MHAFNPRYLPSAFFLPQHAEDCDRGGETAGWVLRRGPRVRDHHPRGVRGTAPHAERPPGHRSRLLGPLLRMGTRVDIQYQSVSKVVAAMLGDVTSVGT